MRRHLHVVPQDPASSPAAAGPAPGSGDGGDLAVMGMLFGVNLVPLVGAAVAHGRWGPGTLGLATAGALLTGRELVHGVLPRLRSGGQVLPRLRSGGQVLPRLRSGGQVRAGRP